MKTPIFLKSYLDSRQMRVTSIRPFIKQLSAVTLVLDVNQIFFGTVNADAAFDYQCEFDDYFYTKHNALRDSWPSMWALPDVANQNGDGLGVHLLDAYDNFDPALMVGVTKVATYIGRTVGAPGFDYQWLDWNDGSLGLGGVIMFNLNAGVITANSNLDLTGNPGNNVLADWLTYFNNKINALAITRNLGYTGEQHVIPVGSFNLVIGQKFNFNSTNAYMQGYLVDFER